MATSQDPPPTFDFPREYHFPPFFTLQPNLSTRHAQLTKWSSLVLGYARQNRIFRLSPSAAATDPAHPAAAVFHNSRLSRRLSAKDAREVLDFMRRDGRAERIRDGPGSGSGSGGSARNGDPKDMFWIYWRTPHEWAAVVENWIEQTGQKGTVLTLYELAEGESTEATEFHGMDPELLRKSISIVVQKGKAQIFGNEDSQGVKFF